MSEWASLIRHRGEATKISRLHQLIENKNESRSDCSPNKSGPVADDQQNQMKRGKEK
jgi:hypothetical protein